MPYAGRRVNQPVGIGGDRHRLSGRRSRKDCTPNDDGTDCDPGPAHGSPLTTTRNVRSITQCRVGSYVLCVPHELPTSRVIACRRGGGRTVMPRPQPPPLTAALLIADGAHTNVIQARLRSRRLLTHTVAYLKISTRLPWSTLTWPTDCSGGFCADCGGLIDPQ